VRISILRAYLFSLSECCFISGFEARMKFQY
jgi:hypothetical protein